MKIMKKFNYSNLINLLTILCTMTIIVVHKYPMTLSVSTLGHTWLIPFASAMFVIPSQILCENLKGRDYKWCKTRIIISLMLAFLVPAILLYFNVGEFLLVASCGLVQCYCPTRVGVKLAEFINISLAMQAPAGPAGNSGVGPSNVPAPAPAPAPAAAPAPAPAPAPEGRIEDDLVYIETNRLITQVRPTGLSVESQSSFVAKEMRESILNSNDPSISWDDSSREAVKTALQDAGMYYSDTGTQNNSALSDLRSSDEEWSSSSADDEHSESEAVGIEDLDWGSASPEQAPDSEHFDSEAAAPEQAADSESNVPQTDNKRSLSESDLESRSSPKKSKQDE